MKIDAFTSVVKIMLNVIFVFTILFKMAFEHMQNFY
jgi:hypothetical protein